MYNLKVKYPKMEKIIFTANTKNECMEKLKSILGYGSCIPSDCSFIIESKTENDENYILF
jgi:hypothetical protein